MNSSRTGHSVQLTYGLLIPTSRAVDGQRLCYITIISHRIWVIYIYIYISYIDIVTKIWILYWYHIQLFIAIMGSSIVLVDGINGSWLKNRPIVLVRSAGGPMAATCLANLLGSSLYKAAPPVLSLCRATASGVKHIGNTWENYGENYGKIWEQRCFFLMEI